NAARCTARCRCSRQSAQEPSACRKACGVEAPGTAPRLRRLRRTRSPTSAAARVSTTRALKSHHCHTRDVTRNAEIAETAEIAENLSSSKEKELFSADSANSASLYLLNRKIRSAPVPCCRWNCSCWVWFPCWTFVCSRIQFVNAYSMSTFVV